MSTKSRWNKPVLAWVAAVFALGLYAGNAQARMYKWKDDQGKVHYTDSVSKIPPKYRKGNNPGFKTLKSAPGNSSVGGGASSRASGFSLSIPQNGVEVPLVPLGNGNYAVEVVFNNSTKLMLMLDTGASMVVLHPSVAGKVGIRNLDQQPKVVVSTAGGKELNSIGVLNSVKVGGAVVTDVEATFNEHMEPDGGLLGMTFLNDFRFEIDRQQNLLILKPLRGGKDKLFGGRPESWWKDKYASYFTGLNRASYMKANSKSRADKVEHQKMATYYQDLIDRLDRQADQARLPAEYRDPFGNRSKKN